MPLASALLCTRNRPHWFNLAVQWWLRQTYPHRELIVVDQSDASAAAANRRTLLELCGRSSRVRYIHRAADATIGVYLNQAAEAAEGFALFPWDDDDWMSPDRMLVQMESLGFVEITLLATPAVYDCRRDTVRVPSWSRVGLAGHAFRRSVWQRAGYSDRTIGQDLAFLHSHGVPLLGDDGGAAYADPFDTCTYAYQENRAADSRGSGSRPLFVIVDHATNVTGGRSRKLWVVSPTSFDALIGVNDAALIRSTYQAEVNYADRPQAA